MELTNGELYELHRLLEDRLLYGDDEVVYMTTESGALENARLTSIKEKVAYEAKQRGRWWAR